MPHTVFSHIWGTLGLLSIMIIVSLYAEGILNIISLQIHRTELKEVAESVAKEIIEVVSIHTLGEEDFTLMDLNIPQNINSKSYVIKLKEDKGSIVLEVYLEGNEIVKVTSVLGLNPNLFRVLNCTIQDQKRRLVYGPSLTLPCERPMIVLFKENDVYFLALGREV